MIAKIPVLNRIEPFQSYLKCENQKRTRTVNAIKLKIAAVLQVCHTYSSMMKFMSMFEVWHTSGSRMNP